MKDSPKLMFGLYEWMDSVIYAVIAIFILFTFLFRVVSVSGKSMQPTLEDKDWLVVSNTFYEAQRGDVVVIAQPAALKEPLVKRIIALEGDKVDINYADGTISVNGTVLEEPYIKEAIKTARDVAFPVEVPPGSVFVLGDNRNDSLDSRSRIVGFIDERYILGKAVGRFYPFGTWSIYDYGK
ncbi:MAG: signal peptidase I [Clostridiales bacterium]|nr:signal peptidase I [Clostridiales bacterium]